MRFCLKFVFVFLAGAMLLGVTTQANDHAREHTGDGLNGVVRTLTGPGSYSHLRIQADGSFGLADLFDEFGNPNYDLSFIESLASNDPSNVTLQRNLGHYYYRQSDFTNSAKWSALAAGHDDVVSATVLGLLALEGKGGVPRDEPRALALFEFAAKQGFTPAMIYLSDCYVHGRGVPPDRSEAIRILRIAAAQRDVDAMRSLAKIYLDADHRFGKRNYLAAGFWGYRGYRQHLKVELAAEKSFVVIQVVEVVAVLIVLTMVGLAIRYVRQLVREFRRPSFLDPGSGVKFAVVQDWEEFKGMVKAYRERESAGDCSQPVPLLVRQAQGFGQGFKKGFGESWHDAPMLLEFDRFWRSFRRWALLLAVAIIGAGFTSLSPWTSHWKLLLMCLAGLGVIVIVVFLVREQWLLDRLIHTRTSA